MKLPIAHDQFKQLGNTTLPAFAATLVPKCPFWWMAILSSLELGSSIGAVWLQPLTLFFLVVALGAVAFRTYRRMAYGAPILGISAAVTIYVSKFIFGLDAGTYLGGAALMGASFWTRDRRQTLLGAFPAAAAG